MSEQLYYNGYIITMEEPIYAEAIFVKDGIIKKVGNFEDLLKFKTTSTELIDLEGKTLIPSFIDPHSHITALGDTLHLVPLKDAKSFNDIIEILKKFKKANNIPPGQWISGFGYDHNSLLEKAMPSKEILDEASIENPILISHASGHMGVVNTLGLKNLNITKDTPDPEGGHIGRVNNTNEPNGYLEENAFIHSSEKIPHPPIEYSSRFVAEAQNIYLSNGITTVQDGMINEIEFQQLNYLSKNNLIKVDIIGYVDLKNSKHLVKDNNKYLNKYVNGFKIGGYKIFLDGSPQGKTAWLTKPYKTSDDGYRGYPIYKDEEVKEFITTALKENMQLLTHCNGDAAADQLINSFSKILSDESLNKDTRPVMIHAQTVRDDQIDKMKEIKMIPSYFVAHTYYWGDIHIENLGEERAFRISPLKTTIEKGVPFTLHQDSPVIMPNMLETIWCAVNRITKSGVIIGDFERITPLEALRGVTINAAYQYFEENKKGSIKEGKNADFAILDKNPLTVNPMDIKNIKVLRTIKNGEVLFSAM